MSVTHRLASAFIPTRVAVVGASDREGSRGRAVWSGVMNSRRVLEAYPVNPKYKYIGLTPCWAGLRDLPHTPELCVIATPSARVESVLKDCAALGIANVLVTPGEGTWTEDRLWQDKLAQTARERGIHLIGPDSVGIMRPDIGLNVSYIPKLAAAGPVGLVCQSAALTAAVLDYAAEAGFGFSSVISSGAEAATGLDEIVDFLAADAKTEIIALQILTVRHPRRLMSALKAAARVKPVIILPPGVSPAAGRLSAARLGTPSADPAVFAAAVARTGAACAESLEDFCAALGLLAFGILPKGSRTACAGNGLGVVNLTADAVTQAGLIPAQLSRSTHTALTALTQSPVLMNDPSDLGPEAAGTLVRDAARVILADPSADALIVSLSPMTAARESEAPALLAEVTREAGKPLLVCRTGGTDVNFRDACRESGLIAFTSARAAASALALALQSVTRTGESRTAEGPETETPADTAQAAAALENARRAHRLVLTESECAALLAAFGIRGAQGAFAATAQEASAAARTIGFPVAVKLSADGIAHKTDAGGVILNLRSEAGVAEAFETLKRHCAEKAPYARLRGVWVERMVDTANAREVAVDYITDPVLGPVITLGAGGLAGSLIRDKVILIPPVTQAQARESIRRSPVAALLRGCRGMPPADEKSLAATLMRLSRLAEALPALAELKLSPAAVDDKGLTVLDASGALCGRPVTAEPDARHMLFAPYPAYLETSVRLSAGALIVRGVKPSDQQTLAAFTAQLSAQDRAALLAGDPATGDLADIDWDRECLLIAADDSRVAPALHAVLRITQTPGKDPAVVCITDRSYREDSGLTRTLAAAAARWAQTVGVAVPKTAAGSIL